MRDGFTEIAPTEAGVYWYIGAGDEERYMILADYNSPVRLSLGGRVSVIGLGEPIFDDEMYGLWSKSKVTPPTSSTET